MSNMSGYPELNIRGKRREDLNAGNTSKRPKFFLMYSLTKPQDIFVLIFFVEDSHGLYPGKDEVSKLISQSTIGICLLVHHMLEVNGAGR